MTTIKGENIERLNKLTNDEECTGNPNYCPCMMHYSERRRLEQQSENNQQSHHEQLDSWIDKIMGNGPNENHD